MNATYPTLGSPVVKSEPRSVPNAELAAMLFDGGDMPFATINGIGYELEVHALRDAKHGHAVVFKGSGSLRYTVSHNVVTFGGHPVDTWEAALNLCRDETTNDLRAEYGEV